MGSMILKSDIIFDGTGRDAYAGYLIIESGKIREICDGALPEETEREAERVIDLTGKVICPGFADVHTFFTGHALSHRDIRAKEGIPYETLRENLNDRPFIEREWKEYMQLLNSRGVTSVKEMGFDDYAGFTDFLKEKEEKGELSLRVSFMSQPDSQPVNIEYGREMAEKFTGEYVRFSGYNHMTDGTIASGAGELKKPYEGTDITCYQEIDWAGLEEAALKADAAGFRYSLHAQGDGAVKKTLDIFEKCRKNPDGTLKNRHAITDLELTDPEDLERMGKLGVVAEVYPQIMCLDPGDVVRGNIRRTIGEERGKYNWNRRKMLDSGVIVSCGTDLPLMIPHMGESIYYACGGYFPEGGEPLNPQNTMTVKELLRAFTWGGQYDLYREEELGTLEPGKLADIAVLAENVFEKDPKDLRELKVSMTIVGGKIVYEA